MNTPKPCCANCASFYPEADGAAPRCWNAVSFIEDHGSPNEQHRDPGLEDVCHDHVSAPDEEVIEMARHLVDLPAECLTLLNSYVECTKVLGQDHPEAYAVFLRAAEKDPTGYLSSLVADQQAAQHDAQILADASPEFVEAMHLASHLKDTLGIEHPETGRALAHAMELAPESFKRDVHGMAVEMGLMPATPDGYTDDGQAVYTLEGFAARMGISIEEAQEAAAEMVADRAARGLPTGVISPDAVIHVTH
jgi:hypothetical protein